MRQASTNRLPTFSYGKYRGYVCDVCGEELRNETSRDVHFRRAVRGLGCVHGEPDAPRPMVTGGPLLPRRIVWRWRDGTYRGRPRHYGLDQWQVIVTHSPDGREVGWIRYVYHQNVLHVRRVKRDGRE